MHQSFLDHLKLEKRYSPHTIVAYENDLVQLAAWLTEHYETASITEANFQALRSWLASLSEAGFEPKTLHRKLSSLRAYFRWLKKYHGLEQDPTAKLQVPKIPSRLPVYVEERQMEQLLEPGVFDEGFEGARDRAIIELFYQTGIRCAELTAIKVQNLDLSQSLLKVSGKRNKERIVPVVEPVSRVLVAYLKERDALEAIHDSDFLFLSKRGIKLAPRLVYKIVNNYLSRVSSLKKKSPHVLRHTFATHMLNKGADLNAIKELLGHASLASTQVYTHNSIEKLKEIHRKAHPKG